MWTTQDACQGLADFIREEAVEVPDPAGNQQEIEDALRLLHDGAYEVTIEGRLHRIVRVKQVITLGADGPEPPHPDDVHFVQWPWHLEP
jgi:hypothetical protein